MHYNMGTTMIQISHLQTEISSALRDYHEPLQHGSLEHRLYKFPLLVDCEASCELKEPFGVKAAD